MRDSIENISQLQKKLNDLQLENQILKSILDRAGLAYNKELSAFRQNDSKEDYDPKQGKRIIPFITQIFLIASTSSIHVSSSLAKSFSSAPLS